MLSQESHVLTGYFNSLKQAYFATEEIFIFIIIFYYSPSHPRDAEMVRDSTRREELGGFGSP